MSQSEAEHATDSAGYQEPTHRYVAQKLADKMGWGQLGHGGGTKRGMVFCFPPKA